MICFSKIDVMSMIGWLAMSAGSLEVAAEQMTRDLSDGAPPAQAVLRDAMSEAAANCKKVCDTLVTAAEKQAPSVP